MKPLFILLSLLILGCSSDTPVNMDDALFDSGGRYKSVENQKVYSGPGFKKYKNEPWPDPGLDSTKSNCVNDMPENMEAACEQIKDVYHFHSTLRLVFENPFHGRKRRNTRNNVSNTVRRK